VVTLNLVQELRPGVWVAEEGGERVLVRDIPPDRQAVYRAAQGLGLPIPAIYYVGFDASHQRCVVIEELVEVSDPAGQASGWFSLRQLTPILTANEPGLARGLLRAVEALAWLHAAGFLHGNLTPRTVLFQAGGRVCFDGLDCLQRSRGERVPCVAYARHYVCREQLEGWVSPATDVRLLGLAFAEAYLGHPPIAVSAPSERDRLTALAGQAAGLGGDSPVLRLVERMTAVEPGDRPDLREILMELRQL